MALSRGRFCLLYVWSKDMFCRTFNFSSQPFLPLWRPFRPSNELYLLFEVMLLFISDEQRLGLNTLAQTTVMCLTFCFHWRMRYWLRGKWDISRLPSDRRTNEWIKQHDSTLTDQDSHTVSERLSWLMENTGRFCLADFSGKFAFPNDYFSSSRAERSRPSL